MSIVDKLLPGETVADIIEFIENNLPGYWYSIYQNNEDSTIVVLGGPSLSCPNTIDRKWAMTKHGDCGFDVSLSLQTPNITNALFILVGNAVIAGRNFTAKSRKKIPDQVSPPRTQSEYDLKKLAHHYDHMVSLLKLAESKGVVFEHIHFGSCTLTADCSIRTIDDDADFMCDLLDGSIAESLWCNLSDLLTYIHDLPVVIEKKTPIPWEGLLVSLAATIDYYIAQPENFTDDQRKTFFFSKMDKIAHFENWNEHCNIHPEYIQYMHLLNHLKNNLFS